MKRKLCSAILLFALAAAMSVASDTGYTVESRATSEIFTTKVVKVLSFQEDGADYLAYVITWKDHEVVVTPLSSMRAGKPYNVGDTVRCQMQQTHRRAGDSGPSRMTFVLLPTGLSASSDEDVSNRIEAVREEIQARRAARGSVASPP